MVGISARRIAAMPAYATVARLDVRCPEPAIERPSGSPPRVVIRGVVGILRDLEQGLAAISQSLAEGVGSTMARN